jgi:hypothetical protein
MVAERGRPIYRTQGSWRLKNLNEISLLCGVAIINHN